MRPCHERHTGPCLLTSLINNNKTNKQTNSPYSAHPMTTQAWSLAEFRLHCSPWRSLDTHSWVFIKMNISSSVFKNNSVHTDRCSKSGGEGCEGHSKQTDHQPEIWWTEEGETLHVSLKPEFKKISIWPEFSKTAGFSDWNFRKAKTSERCFQCTESYRTLSVFPICWSTSGVGHGGLWIFTGCLFNVLCLRSLFDCHKVSSYLGRDAKLECIWLVGRDIKIKKQRQFRRWVHLDWHEVIWLWWAF